LTQTESYATRVITLPLHPRMTEDEVDRVCDVMRRELSGDRPGIRRDRTKGGTPSTGQKA
ncbi:MAG: hypothetical protein HKN29_02545, partial [Rhodothermales bacterium]|nr:hypothetical protein [Rhodothermales bacterium]